MIAAWRSPMPKVLRLLAPCVREFWWAPVTPRPLAWFRLGLASVLLAQALSLCGHLNDLYGRYGVAGWLASPQHPPPGVPDVAWLDKAFGFLGVPAPLVVPMVFAVYVSGLLGLFMGYRTRLTAGVAWFSHTALITSGYVSSYGVDQFAQIGLFYCLIFPVGKAMSFDAAGCALRSGPTFEAWLGLRILQLHVCIAYTASGVEKALGEQWWNGEAIWRAVMSSPLDSPIDCSFLATVPWLAKGLGWMTLLLEAGAAGFVWHPSTRKLWLVGIVGMHLTIALVMNLWTFSATMIVFDVAAFGFLPGKRCRKYARSAHSLDCTGPARDSAAVATLLLPRRTSPARYSPAFGLRVGGCSFHSNADQER